MRSMTWDLILVTARTAQQRWLFERYLGEIWPQREGSGPPSWMVLQDPPGPRLGTAGATVAAVGAAARRWGHGLERARVLVLHCGGFSQRVPQLAHVGKAFAPGAGCGRDTTLFVQVVAELGRLFAESEPGVVVACGDVLYSAPTLGKPCRRNEAVVVAYRTSAEQASRHGVYLWEAGQDCRAPRGRNRRRRVWRLWRVGSLWGMDTGFWAGAVVDPLLHTAGLAPRTDSSPRSSAGAGSGAGWSCTAT